jgi:hypothetical protein
LKITHTTEDILMRSKAELNSAIGVTMQPVGDKPKASCAAKEARQSIRSLLDSAKGSELQRLKVFENMLMKELARIDARMIAIDPDSSWQAWPKAKKPKVNAAHNADSPSATEGE